MKITNVKTWEVRIPMKASHTLSTGTYGASTHVIVRIDTNKGITGYGEASCPYNYAGSINMLITRQLKPQVIGEDPCRIEYLVKKMESVTKTWYKRSGVFGISGIEMALFDIKGKYLNTPLYNLLGGRTKHRVDFLGYLFVKDPTINANEALNFVKCGFKTIKLKVGLDENIDINRVREIRKAVGPDIELRVDSNQGWTVYEAISALRKMEKYNVTYVEQPVAFWDLDGMRRVRDSVGVAVAADEACFTVEDGIELIKKEAADYFLVRVEEAGGLINTRKLAGIGEAAGIPCIMGAWVDTGLATIAKVHFIASSTNFPMRNDSILESMADDILAEPIKFEEGSLAVPEGPGLGVEVDESKLEKYSVL